MLTAAGAEEKDVHECRLHERQSACKGISTWRHCQRATKPRAGTCPYLPTADAAMISCRLATWRAKAPRPTAVAVTVVCGFLPTKALSTAT